MGANIRRNVKIKTTIEFVENMQKVQQEVEVVLKKAQKEIKQQADKEQKKAEV